MLFLKKMRYILSIASLLICLMSISISVQAEEADQYGDIDYSSLYGEAETEDPNQKYYADGLLSETDVETQVSTYANMFSQLLSFSDEEVSYLEEQYKDDAGYEGVFETYYQLKDEDLGSYKSFENITVDEISKSEVKVLFDMVFEKKTETISMELNCFKNLGTVLKSINLTDRNADHKTIGDKLSEAGSNTLMGMGTVFIVLIFISLIISCFKFIPKVTDKFNRKKIADKKVLDDNPETIKKKEQTNSQINIENNTELVAVIMAAISASENVTTDSFVVRSIRRR